MRVSNRRGRLRDVSRREPPRVAGRVPPHDLDAEAAVLSAMLLSRDAIDRVSTTLRAEMFYSDANKALFEAIVELSQGGGPVDLVTVASWFRDREQLAKVGGPNYIGQIADATPAVGNVASHAWIIHEKWRTRRLVTECQRIAAEGYGDVGVVQDFLADAEREIHALAHLASPQEGAAISAAIACALAGITAAAERGDGLTGISTGYEKLDAKTAGLHDGDVMIIAGRPGMGKTAFAMNVGVNVASPGARSAGFGVVVISLEMPRDQLASRMVCTEARVDLGRARRGLLQPDDWRRLTEASSYLSSLPIWIEDQPAIDVATIRAKVRKYQAEYNRPATDKSPARRVGLVIIDYLQLMAGSDEANSREEAIAGISRALKVMSKELGVPVIALSQLNRSVESRSNKDKRPQLSDLRESGAIEQDADTIIFIYRDEYYNAETTNAKGIAELIIAKQRNGPIGKVLTRFSASCTRFDNLAPGDYPEMDDE